MGSRDEDAAQCRLGAEFVNETCLSNAEVAILLQQAKQSYEQLDKQAPEVFEETLGYVNRFSQVKDPVANQALINELRSELEVKVWERMRENGAPEEIKLKEYELAVLLNLKPEEYDETIALIPSLQNKLTEQEIEEIIEKINRSASRTFAN